MVQPGSSVGAINDVWGFIALLEGLWCI